MTESAIAEERRNRIRAALFAYAYEFMNDSMVPDAEYDALCRRIDPRVSTGQSDLDEFFRTAFDPDTGLWIHHHPDLPGIAALYHRLHTTPPDLPRTTRHRPPGEWEPPSPFVPKLFSTCVTGRYLWLDLSLAFGCPEGEWVATYRRDGQIVFNFNWEFDTPDPTGNGHFDKVVRLPYADWWGRLYDEGLADNRRYHEWINTRRRVG